MLLKARPSCKAFKSQCASLSHVVSPQLGSFKIPQIDNEPMVISNSILLNSFC